MSDSDLVDRRARNFYVFAGAIIVYLLAGADLEQLTVMGLRVPSRFPVVFSAAAVFAMLWFWWRYLTASLDAGTRAAFRYDFLSALHNTNVFRRYILKRIDLDEVIEKRSDDVIDFPSDPVPREIIHRDQQRFMITVSELYFVGRDTDSQISVVGAESFPGSVPFRIKVPWWLHFGVGFPYYWLRAFRHDGISNQVLPHLALVIALILVASKLWFVDPAGVFGMLAGPDR